MLAEQLGCGGGCCGDPALGGGDYLLACFGAGCSSSVVLQGIGCASFSCRISSVQAFDGDLPLPFFFFLLDGTQDGAVLLLGHVGNVGIGFDK